MNFSEFLFNEGGRRTAGKTGNYPLGYAGIGLYPDADYLTRSADAIVYLTNDKRLYSNGDNPPFDITHLPGHKQYGDHINNGDGAPFSIKHLPGKVIPPKPTTVPGKTISFKNFVKLVTKPTEISPKSRIPNA